jgi:hypothetical protein
MNMTRAPLAPATLKNQTEQSVRYRAPTLTPTLVILVFWLL